MFVGLLFKYSDKYPHLKDYAVKYAEPLLETEFDGSGEKRFMYALIPGFEKTQDERYLKKLINVTDTLINYYSIEEGTTQCNDLYSVELALYVYNKTNNRKYLEFSEKLSKKFIINNIDRDGYVYLAATLVENEDGTLNYERWGKLVTSFDIYSIGMYYGLFNISESKFKSITSPYSRDFVQVMLTLYDVNMYSKNYLYTDTLDSVSKYYLDSSSSDYIDYLFVSNINEENNIPKDTLATVQSLYFFENNNSSIYYYKLRGLLSSKYFLKENEKAILTNSVIIENMRYDNTNRKLRNQSIIDTDALFLELNVR